MPKAENLRNVKLPREDADKPGVPRKIKIGNNENFELWFKQDDTFEQPFVWINMKIKTIDGGYPYTLESGLYSMLW